MNNKYYIFCYFDILGQSNNSTYNCFVLLSKFSLKHTEAKECPLFGKTPLGGRQHRSVEQEAEASFDGKQVKGVSNSQVRNSLNSTFTFQMFIAQK